MSLRKPVEYISVEDYLEGEKESPIRHEYVDGHVFAMAGASDRHNRIAINLSSWLNGHLAEGECAVFMSDMKVLVTESIYYYPDVVVACDPPGGDRYTRRQPLVIIEVTSPSTRRADRFEKLSAYKRIKSLQEVILISQSRMLVEAHRRRGAEWQMELLTKPEDELRLESVGLSLTLAEIYRNVDLDDTSEADEFVQEP